MFTIRHLRPQGTLYSKVPARQFRSTRFRLSEEKIRPTDHSVQEQTAQVYLDNVFPLKLNTLDIRQLVFRNTKGFLESRARQAIPSEELPHSFQIKNIAARTKDGGAIVTFGFKSVDEKKKQVAKDIVARISEHIQKGNIVAPFNFQSVRSFLVKGTPFMEDMLARYPSPRLRIEFQGEPVHIERLYKHLRQYGRVADVTYFPNPTTTKDPARYAIAQFTRIRSATSARNCLHGHDIDGTRLNILYERQMKTNIVKDFLVNHPRIAVPLFAALVAGVTYAIFDPVRMFFVTSKITQRFNPQEYALYRWLRNETWGHFSQPTTAGKTSVWADDKEKTEKLKSWLAETPETFLLITGHKGSGKSALIKSAISERKNKLVIDCEKLSNARNTSDITKELAKQVGYFPVFTWVASLSGLLDTFVFATTGQKSGLSSSPENQIKQVLETVAVSLRDIVPNESEKRRQAEEKENKATLLEKFERYMTGHKRPIQKKVKTDEESEQERKALELSTPVVIIDNYLHRETAKSEVLWKEIAEWASLLIENEVAHVVIVSSNAGVIKPLAKALPGKSFSNIVLSDAPPDVSLQFVYKQLGEEVNDPNIRDVVSALGGRLTELEILVQKMKMNMDAKSAFDDIVARNVAELRKYGFGDASDPDNHSEWTSVQFWAIVKQLTNVVSINYDELKWGSIFNGDDAPLKAMERSELIAVTQKEGRADSIQPGKPVFYTVFNHLVADPIFNASMEIETNMFLKKNAEADIAKLESTIEKLTNINQPNKPPKEIEPRIKYLLAKVVATEQAIEGYDAKISQAKDAISKAWSVEEEKRI